MERMVKVYQARDFFEGHFLIDMLETAGIEAHMVSENTPFGGVMNVERPRVWVFESDQDRALELLREYESRRPAQPPSER